jgi:hypothetical protein
MTDDERVCEICGINENDPECLICEGEHQQEEPGKYIVDLYICTLHKYSCIYHSFYDTS